MSDVSTRFGITEPSADRADSADVPRDIRAVVAALESLGAQYKQGAIGTRPVSTPGSPGKAGRFFMQTDVTPHVLHYDFGTGWDPVGMMADGSVETAMIQDGAVITVKLADGAVVAAKIADGTITAVKIADNTITATKLVDALVPSRGAGGGAEALRAIGTAAGQVVAGNDVRLIPVTVVLALPGAPSNGDECILVDSLTAPTWAVRFKYLTGITSDGHKWLNVGDGKIVARDTGDRVNAAATNDVWFDMTGNDLTITVPVDGNYELDLSALFYGGGGGVVSIVAKIGAAAVVDADSVGDLLSTGNNITHPIHVHRPGPSYPLVLTAGTVIKMQHRAGNNALNTHFTKRTLALKPVRVG